MSFDFLFPFLVRLLARCVSPMCKLVVAELCAGVCIAFFCCSFFILASDKVFQFFVFVVLRWLLFLGVDIINVCFSVFAYGFFLSLFVLFSLLACSLCVCISCYRATGGGEEIEKISFISNVVPVTIAHTQKFRIRYLSLRFLTISFIKTSSSSLVAVFPFAMLYVACDSRTILGLLSSFICFLLSVCLLFLLLSFFFSSE